jgi:hypothetical protein
MMKKLFILSFVFLLLNTKSYSQTKQFPFYGFELSNYEVGDTLEYYSNYWQPPGPTPSYIDTDIYTITKKENISSDTIRYTIQDTYSFYIPGSNPITKTQYLERLITNNAIYNNNNNILEQLLPAMDTTPGNSFQYDTIIGRKTLWVSVNNINIKKYTYNVLHYEAIQNLGLTTFSNWTNPVPPFYMDTLIYANLAHYGIYGTYSKLIDNINQPSVFMGNISIRNDNGNAYLFLTSSQNLSSPVLTIYDLLGRPLETKQINIGSNPINLNNFAKGIYLYKVTSNGNVLGQGKLMNL